jgi:translation elongation factor EF-1alpha
MATSGDSRHVLIGTAGHIDHGKTRLVGVLTGIDTDRLPEEKARGISIDLGFAHWEADGFRFGVVDVPGHERFVRNMVAGATGVNLALLVVAADDGVMPQTREHLDIMDLLGVRTGVVARNSSRAHFWRAARSCPFRRQPAQDWTDCGRRWWTSPVAANGMRGRACFACPSTVCCRSLVMAPS